MHSLTASFSTLCDLGRVSPLIFRDSCFVASARSVLLPQARIKLQMWAKLGDVRIFDSRLAYSSLTY